MWVSVPFSFGCDMKIREYLSKKYEVEVPTTLTRQEARAFGIPYPTPTGWLRTHGDREITTGMAGDALGWLRAKGENATNERKKAWAARGVAILEGLAAGHVAAPWVSPRKEAKAERKLAKKAKREARKSAYVANPAASDDFLQTYEWRRVRMLALKKYGARCQCCGATPMTGAVMNVDHIKPRRLFPALALDVDNLQVLCGSCNHGKGNWDMTDWRETAGAK